MAFDLKSSMKMLAIARERGDHMGDHINCMWNFF